MATGFYDANGIWQYGEDDNIALFSDTLNKLADSTSDAFTSDRSRLSTLEAGSLAGLIPVKPGTVTAVTGTAAVNNVGLVTFTGCTKIQLDGVFNSRYTHYKLLLSVTSSAANSMIQFRFIQSGSENSSANYYIQNVEASGSSISTYRQAGISGLNDFSYGVAGNPSTTEANIYNPFTSVKPQVMSRTARDLYNGAGIMETHGGINLTNSFTGISIISNTSNITGKAIVYGWNE